MGDRVILTGPPPDVAQSKRARGQHLWNGKVGVVTDGPWGYGDLQVYRVRLDEDLVEAQQHGWVTNNFVIAEAALQRITVAQQEVEDVLASIQAAVRNRQNRKATQ